MKLIEVGHCRDCCKKYDTHNKCNPNNPLIKHLPKEDCLFCKEDLGVIERFNILQAAIKIEPLSKKPELELD